MKVCIAGGGKVGLYLAQSLLAHHHKVTIIEPPPAIQTFICFPRFYFASARNTDCSVSTVGQMVSIS